MTRIYLPATLAVLRELRDVGKYRAERAHAVTPGLREWYTEGDIEDLEYVAFTRAAQDSLWLLRAAAAPPRRRVVVSADLPDTELSAAGGDLGDSGVGLLAPVALSGVAAIHVDSSAADTDVTVAVGALPEAKGGDPDLQFIVESVEDHELEWYDTTELEQLLA
ncbi:MAG: DUF6912 family protein [Stackebrandtia sp.]